MIWTWEKSAGKQQNLRENSRKIEIQNCCEPCFRQSKTLLGKWFWQKAVMTLRSVVLTFEIIEVILCKFTWVISPTILDKRVSPITYIHCHCPLFIVVFSTFHNFSNIHQNKLFSVFFKFQMLTPLIFQITLSQVGFMSKLTLNFLYVVLNFQVLACLNSIWVIRAKPDTGFKRFDCLCIIKIYLLSYPVVVFNTNFFRA